MVEKLRERHPRLVYTSYKMAQTGNELVVVYTYLLEPDSTFESTYRFPCPSKIELSLVEPFCFNLVWLRLSAIGSSRVRKNCLFKQEH